MDLQTVLALLLVALAAIALVRHQARAFGPAMVAASRPDAAKPSGCSGCPSGGSCSKKAC
jgi:hypothetical protein